MASDREKREAKFETIFGLCFIGVLVTITLLVLALVGPYYGSLPTYRILL